MSQNSQVTIVEDEPTILMAFDDMLDGLGDDLAGFASRASNASLMVDEASVDVVIPGLSSVQDNSFQVAEAPFTHGTSFLVAAARHERGA